MWELVVIWWDGEREVFSGYEDRASAEESGEGFKMAFGDQVDWFGTRRAA